VNLSINPKPPTLSYIPIPTGIIIENIPKGINIEK
jgi:hypothetical protein